ncbi:MAG TPA: DHH family phosphoesterase, partial [Candidatus Binatia bacterium]|nr:DHH family phosphoesterase [Candidatus Binatia bacterium]
VVALRPARRAAVLAALRRVAPAAPVVLLGPDGPADLPALGPAVFLERLVEPELERAVTRSRVERVRRHFEQADHVLIMVQDDPDPDAIASALALRTLLGRTRGGATIATFGSIGRPENRAMARILDIDVEHIVPGTLGEFDRVAMVDTQPSFFEERFPEVDLVVDHHPEPVPVRARLKDVRPGYGATATILTEYLRAADVKISSRLATALLYGIKADTLSLERGATRNDMEAFAHLHGLANHSALRRIERPELPAAALDRLAAALAGRRLVDGVLFAHLGEMPYRELAAQFAELFLQVEGTEWTVVSGSIAGELHVSVRNVGYVRAAGEVVRQAFGDLGSAGGHRAMAKAVIPLAAWPAGEDVARGIEARFLGALRGGRGRGSA